MLRGLRLAAMLSLVIQDALLHLRSEVTDQTLCTGRTQCCRIAHGVNDALAHLTKHRALRNAPALAMLQHHPKRRWYDPRSDE